MENVDEYVYPTHVNASFDSRPVAEKAYDELIYRGYKQEEINVLFSDEQHPVHGKLDKEEGHTENKTMEKAGVGSAIGGTTGAVLGAVAALGTAVLIPPLGIAVAGPLLAGLAGAGAGGFAGGLIGALVGSGMSKEHADIYDAKIKEGGIIISFTPKTVEDRIEIITSWNNLGGRQLHGNENFTI
ncbi:hypothetical protein [Dyadobacter psychrotolerans]|uniref:DUF1269 domain-containing protein n=1 Tax=Dyadobacter psychrotolerans TaxID=2541721 RepID=A0A4R5DRA8_9BACT|nr:hypothetical protein [Dyadobacter psychrotolerans]TDE14591.1 hypothetical protein E0F88_15470 [Dyadobacter psychrotolerans]